jgi:hypothetical protein
MTKTASLLLLLSSLLGTTLSSQSPRATAGWMYHGDDCGAPCLAQNDNRGAGRTGTLPNEYAFGAKFTQAQTIVAFQLYTTTNTLPTASLTGNLFRESTATPGQPDVNPVASGTLTAIKQLDFYTVFLNAPVQVAANETIWIGQSESTNILASGLTSGATPPVKSFYRRTGVLWTASTSVAYPAWRILCSTDVACSSPNPPKLGTTTSLDLQGAPPSAPSVLFLGATNPGLALGFCTKLLSSGELALSATTSATGTASMPLAIPSSASLDGALVWCQWWAIGAGPSLIGTHGAQATLGN